MSDPAATGRRGQLRLGDLLLQAGVIDAEQLERALSEQKKWGGRLGRALVDLGFVDEQTMSLALARHLRLPYFDFAQATPPADVVELLSVHVCERLAVMPVGLDAARNTMRVATSEPTDVEALRELAELTGRTIEPVVASASDIDSAVRRFYYGDARQSAGVSLPGFVGMERVGGSQPRPLVPPSAAAAVPPSTTVPASTAALASAAAAAPGPAPAPTASAAELAARVSKLEELLAQQSRVLRALVEQLAETKVLDREAFQKRARGR